MSAHYLPLAHVWPKHVERTKQRITGPYRTSLQTTAVELERELRGWGAKNAVVGSDLTFGPSGINASTVRDPGVAVRFEIKGITLTLAIDRYYHLQDNYRALMLSVASLRRLERDGTQQIFAQVVSGLKALPSPADQASPWSVLEVTPGASAEVIEAAYRAKAKRTHPDQGGSADAFQALQRAREAALREVRHG
jgi:DnaJ domain